MVQEQNSPALGSDDIKKEVVRYSWYHTMDLGGGVITPGMNNTSDSLAKIKLPESLQSMRILDIGACDGFYSFEAERRKAKEVLAVDLPEWGTNGRGNGKEKFELARRLLGSKVKDLELNVYDLDPAKVGIFDIVLFLGVLYHLKHPLLALERIYSVTKQLLILETHVDMLAYEKPAAIFYPETELNNDSTNWWGPNELLVCAMLKTVGFTMVEVVSRTHGPQPQHNRIVCHARR